MITFSFNPDCLPNTSKEKDVLSTFKNRSEKPEQIVPGMSPEEISEVVSDKVIEVVREQFQNTKNLFWREKK